MAAPIAEPKNIIHEITLELFFPDTEEVYSKDGVIPTPHDRRHILSPFEMVSKMLR